MEGVEEDVGVEGDKQRRQADSVHLSCCRASCLHQAWSVGGKGQEREEAMGRSINCEQGSDLLL